MYHSQRKFQFDSINNHLGHLGYLNSISFEKIKIQLGINQAMLQNFVSIDSKKFDLWDFEFKVFSQWGEDGIINHILNVLDIPKPNCVEIGIENFTECNSRFLAEYRNSNLYLIDSNDDARSVIDNLDLRWKSTLEFECTLVTSENINSILERARGKIGCIDVLSIDVDGIDYWLLAEIDKFDFSLIVVEYNSLFGSKHSVTVPYKSDFDRSKEHFSHQFYGASISAYMGLLSEKGYSFLGTNRANSNAFFVKSSEADRFRHLRIREKKEYTLANIRESRNEGGELTFLSQSESHVLLGYCELFELRTQQKRLVKEILE